VAGAKKHDDRRSSSAHLIPRKHVPLGTMFPNGVEVSTAIIVYQSMVQHINVMKNPPYGERSIMPNSAEIGASTAEVIHKVDEVNVVPGYWVCSEA
jgi:hypothetical protein